MIFHNHLRFALFSAFLSAGTFLLPHSQRAASADDLAEGERLYQIHCAGCHGSKGEGGRGTVLAAPNLSRASTEAAMINVIARGIPGTEMLGARLEWQQVRQVAAWVRKLGQQQPQQISGDARRGEQLYLGKGDCASCHAIRTQGGVSGPDLTEIGLRRGSEYLRKALLEPEADVPENFSQYRWHTVIPDNFLRVRVVTKDGRRITGLRLNEDPFSIQLRDLSGRIRSFSKSELAKLHKDWGKSFMPSYRGVFSSEELDDVIAFLLSLQGAQ
jgi:cytochrome c oxidase cbb3-type subunit III